jgi:hypothetical protein
MTRLLLILLLCGCSALQPKRAMLLRSSPASEPDPTPVPMKHFRAVFLNSKGWQAEWSTNLIDWTNHFDFSFLPPRAERAITNRIVIEVPATEAQYFLRFRKP